LGALGLFSALVFVVITVITSVLGVTGTVAAYRQVNGELPNAADIAVETFQTTRIYDRNGDLLQEVDNPDYGWRTFVSLDQVSPYLVDATVAAEDATFWTNPGIEPAGIARAAVINVSGTGSSGASTITQQLVRSIYPEKIGFEVSYTRKFREALAAIALDQQYSKTDIITMYLNQIYYGARSYGIEAAAQTFFHKKASELTLAEASLLAGLPQAPSYYDPSVPDNFPLAKRRQQYVLDQMVKYRYITQEEANAAWNEPLDIHGNRTGAVRNAPHFTQYVREYIIENYGIDALYGGLEITTSIDLDLQYQAEQIVADGVRNMEQYQRNNGAAVVMVPWSGEILAMVGSADFNNALIAGQVNYATSLIQPGSSIKPLVYAAAFEQGWHPGSVILDVPTSWDSPGQPEPYEPQNYTRQFYGAMSARDALANSLNIPAVKATEYAGISGVMDLTRRMGYEDSLANDSSFYGLSLGLGSGEVELLEHTNAFATLANNGAHVPVHPILKITDSQGNVLFELDEEQIEKEREQALPSGNAYQVTSILTDTEAREMMFTSDNLFTRTQNELDRPVAAKSGTTENWRDLWTMGYTTDISIGVWVGRSGDTNPDEMLSEIDGIQAAGPIWQDLMQLVHNDAQYAQLLDGPDGTPLPEEFPVPDDVREMEVCETTGNRATSGEATEEWLVRGQEPQNACGELTEYQREQLDEALEAVREGDANWARGAINSIRRYDAVADGRPISSSSDSDNEDEEQVIEPAD
ncbi:MAG: transglycosylase domain-containing protein, partial [Chloroflexota bacterium]|nr:transglycosylase domain-containing protein [Chloroflexota bacterium]